MRVAPALGLGVAVAFGIAACADSGVGATRSGVTVLPPVAGMGSAAAGSTAPLAGSGGTGTPTTNMTASSGAGGVGGAAGIGPSASGNGGTGMSAAGGSGAAGTMAVAGTGGGSSGTGGAAPMIGDAQPRIPPMPASCPTIASGNITVKGQSVTLWVGPAGKPGPMVFYWHGTGGQPSEATRGLGPGFDEVMSQGGVIASFSTSTKTGQNTGNNVWYTGDFEMADEIFACALDQGFVDPRQVFTGGCSAGGLQASAMVYNRSSYLAAAMPNSGGNIFPYPLEDPSHVPAVITTHGAAGRDVVVIDFADTSAQQCMDIPAKGGFMVNCDHGGGHCGSPAEVKTAQWQFLKAHPFGVDPEPYASGLPSGFPSVCEICM
jgi:hypothetical protein